MLKEVATSRQIYADFFLEIPIQEGIPRSAKKKKALFQCTPFPSREGNKDFTWADLRVVKESSNGLVSNRFKAEED